MKERNYGGGSTAIQFGLMFAAFGMLFAGKPMTAIFAVLVATWVAVAYRK